jgi:exopolysaccharide production protein ExoQ
MSEVSSKFHTKFHTKFRFLEHAFVIFTFLVLTGGVVDLLNESRGLGPTAAAHPVTRLASMVVQIGVILLVIIWRQQVWRVAVRSWWLWAFLGLIVCSSFWSEFPSSTFRNSIFMLQNSLFAIYLAARFTLQQQLRLLAWAFGIAIILSFLVAILLPSYGVMGRGEVMTPEAIAHQGAWRGIYIHKNPFGRIMNLSALVFLVQTGDPGRQRRWMWAGFVGSVMLVLLSTSKTSLMILVALIALVPLFRLWRLNYSRSVPLFIGLTLLGSGGMLLLLDGAEVILSAFGRDMTLTGRTELWELSLEKISEQPLLGFGYTGFWRRMAGESAEILLELGWEVPHSHNGLIDLTLDLGLVGLLLFLTGFAFTCWRAVRRIQVSHQAADLWPLAYLAFLFLANLTESSLLRQNSLWVLYVAAALTITQRVAPPQSSAQQGLRHASPKPQSIPAQSAPIPTLKFQP